MNAFDAMKKWREENAQVVRKKIELCEKEREKTKKRNDPRWYRLLSDYYDLCDELGTKADKELVQDISIETLAEIVEVLREK